MGDDALLNEGGDALNRFEDNLDVFPVVQLLSARRKAVQGHIGVTPVVLYGRIGMDISQQGHSL